MPAHAAATIVIVNNDGAGEGFNDPTLAAPVGGNTGTTLGQQRLIAFQAAASIWGARLTSSVPIQVLANFDPLTCTATSAVLGAAGRASSRATSRGPRCREPGTRGARRRARGSGPGRERARHRARFNLNLGQAGCLTGTFFYLGLDNNHGTQVDLVTVLIHEFGHGFGFQTFTSGTTGSYLVASPRSSTLLLDQTANKL